MAKRAKIIPFPRRVPAPGRDGRVASWTSDEWLQFQLSSLVIEGMEYIELDVMTPARPEPRGRGRPRRLCHITTTRAEIARILTAIRPASLPTILET